MTEAAAGGRRADRRARTQVAIVEAARALQRQGVDPTVTQAAAAAGVPRATAYRYFPTQDALRLELAMTQDILAAGAVADRPLTREDVGDRVPELLTGFLSDVLDHDVLYRSILRTYLDHSLATGDSPRPGRRTQWIEKVLSPLRTELSEDQLQRLVTALALLTGVEAAVVLRDVCRVTPEEGLAAVDWAARVLVAAAIAQARENV